MSPKIRHTLTAVAAVGAAALAGTAIAGAASDPGSSTSDNRAGEHRGPNEEALTGATATKVKEAALAEVPGTVVRVETDEGGVYEAHIRKSDGTEVEVKVGEDFKVTAVEEHDRP